MSKKGMGEISDAGRFLPGHRSTCVGNRGRRKALQKGDTENGMWWAGQVQGLIEEALSCREVVDTFLDDAVTMMATSSPSLLAAS